MAMNVIQSIRLRKKTYPKQCNPQHAYPEQPVAAVAACAVPAEAKVAADQIILQSARSASHFYRGAAITDLHGWGVMGFEKQLRQGGVISVIGREAEKDPSRAAPHRTIRMVPLDLAG